MTMKMNTAHRSTVNGTTRSDAPLTRKVTSGAKATSMIRSFKATCTRV